MNMIRHVTSVLVQHSWVDIIFVDMGQLLLLCILYYSSAVDSGHGDELSDSENWLPVST